MAVMIAGAGAAYLNGGLGKWEFVFTAVITYCAYKGLRSYGFIGIGWILHAAWDVVHHLYGTPIVPFVAMSSFGCAICDPVIAIGVFSARLPFTSCFVLRKFGRVNPAHMLVSPLGAVSCACSFFAVCFWNEAALPHLREGYGVRGQRGFSVLQRAVPPAGFGELVEREVCDQRAGVR
jgi:hypothetical protein